MPHGADDASSDDVVLHFVVAGPRIEVLRVQAGTTAQEFLCWGAWDIFATVNGIRVPGNAPDNLKIDPSPSCTTPVT